MCENEADLFLPYNEQLLNSDDPNVREAQLQLLIFMAGEDKIIDQEDIIHMIVERLIDEKDFVREKAIQALIAIGKNNPSIITRFITEFVKHHPDNEELKREADKLLKSMVTVEKIDKLVEKNLDLKPVLDKEKEKDSEIRSLEHTTFIKEILKDEIAQSPVGEFEKDASEMLEKEMSLIKKQMEIEKKRLELEKKEKELEEKELIEKEKTLQAKEKLIEKDIKIAELTQVELELKEKTIEEKQKQILEQEAKRMQEKIKDIERKEQEDENKN